MWKRLGKEGGEVEDEKGKNEGGGKNPTLRIWRVDSFLAAELFFLGG